MVEDNRRQNSLQSKKGMCNSHKEKSPLKNTGMSFLFGEVFKQSLGDNPERECGDVRRLGRSSPKARIPTGEGLPAASVSTKLFPVVSNSSHHCGKSVLSLHQLCLP